MTAPSDQAVAPPPAVDLPLSDDPFEDGFRAFHAEIERAIAQAPVAADAAAAAVEARRAHQALGGLLDQQDVVAATRIGRAQAWMVAPARYLKAALADELLLRRDWAGRTAWDAHLLETAQFGTRVAGERVFDEIERLLQQRDPAARPLARLYLFALGLGFQGRWRQAPADASPLDALRADLHRFAFALAEDEDVRARRLAPQAYEHTASHLERRRRRPPARGAMVWVAAALLLLLASQAAWVASTWSLRAPAAAEDPQRP